MSVEKLGSPESPKTIKDLRQLPKGYKWDTDVQYFFLVGGKKYVFFHDGTGGIVGNVGKKKNVLLYKKPAEQVVSIIKATQKQVVEREIQLKKQQEQKNREQARKRTQPKQLNSLDDEIRESNKLVSELQTFLDQGDIQGVNASLQEKQSDYEDLIQTTGFRRQLRYALENYKGSLGQNKTKYTIIIQLQARFGYNLGNSIDGIWGDECNEVQAQREKEELRNLKESVGFKTLYDNLEREIKNGKNITKYLESNYQQYKSLVASDWFLNKLKTASQSPETNALYLQLYGRLVLNDASVALDGKYGFQTKSIAERYLLAEAQRKDAEGIAEEEQEKERQKKRLDLAEERYNSAPQEKKVAMDISQMFNESMSKEDNDRYFKLLGLSDEKVDQFLTAKEKTKKPEKVQKIREKKKMDLYKKVMTTAQVSCVHFIQGVFNTTINIKDVQPIVLTADIDAKKNAKTHDGQSIDFNIAPNGIPLKICYNLVDGTIKYESSFDMNVNGLTIGKEGYESTVLEGAPSLVSFMDDAKGEIGSVSKSGKNGRKEAMGRIRSLSEPKIGQEQRQSIEKMVAREDCMKSIRELTGYTIPSDLAKGIYQNTQIYTLYDMLDRTFKNSKTTVQDIYNFKYNIVEKFKLISAEYLDPKKPKIDNLRKRYLSQDKLKQDKQDLLFAKLDTQPEKSLSFYSLFNQFLKAPSVGETDKDYRVLDFQKMESYINKYYQLGYLPDTSMVAAIETKEKSELEMSFEASLNAVA